MTKHFNSSGDQQRSPLNSRKQGRFFSQACFLQDNYVPLEYLHWFSTVPLVKNIGIYSSMHGVLIINSIKLHAW
jgi:hypothetical protein